MDKKTIVNDIYHACLVTLGAVAVSKLTQKITGQSLTQSESFKEVAKLTVSVAVSSYLVKMAQDKDYIPVNLEK